MNETLSTADIDAVNKRPALARAWFIAVHTGSGDRPGCGTDTIRTRTLGDRVNTAALRLAGRTGRAYLWHAHRVAGWRPGSFRAEREWSAYVPEAYGTEFFRGVADAGEFTREPHETLLQGVKRGLDAWEEASDAGRRLELARRAAAEAKYAEAVDGLRAR